MSTRGVLLGLDNFVSRTPDDVVLTTEDELTLIASGIDLCGGLFSDGTTSFRGKVYEMLVLEVTGESLTREWLPPETLAEMADKLDECDPETVGEDFDLGERWTPSPGEIRDLRRLFRICAERGLGLIAWA
ncbi:MAG: hypothetical protein R2826_00045 [Thermoleophilia bacterium]